MTSLPFFSTIKITLVSMRVRNELHNSFVVVFFSFLKMFSLKEQAESHAELDALIRCRNMLREQSHQNNVTLELLDESDTQLRRLTHALDACSTETSRGIQFARSIATKDKRDAMLIKALLVVYTATALYILFGRLF